MQEFIPDPKMVRKSRIAYRNGEFSTTQELKNKLMQEYVLREQNRGACDPYPLPFNTHLILSERPMGGDWFKPKDDSHQWEKSEPTLNQIDPDEYTYYWIARES